MKNKYWWIVGIVCIVLFLYFGWVWFWSIQIVDQGATASIIPEPYKNPNYCDENIGCDYYRARNEIGIGTYCGNIYYVNSTESTGIKVFDEICTCNLTENKCIILSANK